QDVTRRSPKDRDIAMVFQNYALYPHLNVEENIGMGLKLRGMPVESIRAKVGEAAGKLGLGDFLARKPSALSGGQRQRVALARALVRDPKAYLLDEPLSNLDAVLREKTRGELKLLFKRVRGTAIYVTHDQVEAMTLSDRIVVLNRGHIQQVGAPDDIYHRPANIFVAGFLGAPPMNVFPAAAGAAAGLLEVPPDHARPLLCGIRPEDVEVSGSGGARASVALAEPTGPHTILTLECGGVSLRATQPGSWDAGRNAASVRLPADRLHFFDAETEARVAFSPQSQRA
ncbi:MAG: ABC transporter ATP-binding protein, partial [Elusimicrobia bacterium]|nr:ABC transporter ATP-binding protein [Elusimicrobiota bacterium]